MRKFAAVAAGLVVWLLTVLFFAAFFDAIHDVIVMPSLNASFGESDYPVLQNFLTAINLPFALAVGSYSGLRVSEFTAEKVCQHLGPRTMPVTLLCVVAFTGLLIASLESDRLRSNAIVEFTCLALPLAWVVIRRKLLITAKMQA